MKLIGAPEVADAIARHVIDTCATKSTEHSSQHSDNKKAPRQCLGAFDFTGLSQVEAGDQ